MAKGIILLLLFSLGSLVTAPSQAAYSPGSIFNWQYRLFKNLEFANQATWAPISIGGLKLAREYQGYIEYQADFDLESKASAEELGIFFGQIGDVDKVYINDQLIGQTGGFPPAYENNMDVVREYLIPQSVLAQDGHQHLRVLAYVEHVALKGVDLNNVQVGIHRELQHQKYRADLSWYLLRMLIPILCLVLAGVSLPWLAPKGLRAQQAIILALGLTCFIFGTCRSRTIFHFLSVTTAYKLTGFSSVLAVSLIVTFGLFISNFRSKLAFVFAALPLTYFWPTILLQKNLLGAAAIVKQWFYVETLMIWVATALVWKRAGKGKGWIKTGYLLLALIISNDVLRDLRIFKFPVLMDVGFGIFVTTIIFSQIISLRRSWTMFAQREAAAKLGEHSMLLNHDVANAVARATALVQNSNLEPSRKDKVLSALGGISENIGRFLNLVKTLDVHPSENSDSSSNNVCSLGGVVQTCIDEQVSFCTSKNIEIIADIPRKAYTVFIPLSFVETSRAISNILTNAIQASSAGSKILVTVTLGETCEIMFKDHGSGFDQEVLTSVLSEKRKTTKSKGTGLGIISSKKLIETAGGDFQITSSSSGTIVRITLPRTRPPKWFFNIANSTSEQIVALDDNLGIRDTLVQMFPDKEVFLTKDESEFARTINTFPDATLLIDFDYGGSKNGLELINEFNLESRAILVSGRASFDQNLCKAASDQSIKVFPKECFPHFH